MKKASVVATARMLHEVGKHKEALDTLSPLLADTEDSTTLGLGADILFELGDYAEAKRLAGLALAANEQNYDALTRFALAQAKLGDKRGAFKSAGELVKRHPRLWAAHTQFAMIEVEIDWVASATLQHAHEGVRLAPHQSVAHATLGDVYHSLGMKKQAADSYREALRLDPMSSHAQHNLAVATMRGSRTDSVQEFATILATNPNWELAAYNLIAAVATALRFLNLLLLGIFLAAIAATIVVEVTAPDTSDVPIPLRIVLALFAAGLAFGIVRWFRAINRRMPRAAKSLLRFVARKEPVLILWAIPLALMSILVIAAPFLPGGLALVPYLLMWPLLLFSGVLGWIRLLAAWTGPQPKQ